MYSVAAGAAWRAFFAAALAPCVVEGTRTSQFSAFDGWQNMTKEQFLAVGQSFFDLKRPSAKQLIGEPEQGYAPPSYSGLGSMQEGYTKKLNERRQQYGDWLVKVFDVAGKMSFPAKVDVIGRHQIEYVSLLVDAFAFPETGDEMQSRIDMLLEAKHDIKAAVEKDWAAVPKKDEVVRAEDFINYVLDKYRKQITGDPWDKAYMDYLSSLFTTLAPASLDARKRKHSAALDKRRFSQAVILAGEFYFPRPLDALNDLDRAHLELENAWSAVPKVEGEDRVDQQGFTTYFEELHSSRFILDPQHESNFKKAFKTHLGKAFDVGVSMMLPAQKTTVGKHCFRYAAMVANEFYFPGSGADKLGLVP